ncbi:immunity-related GTPase family M protein-like isoform X2 [Nannospalax galili]|uniref:Immunity-related GTPase family M member 1 n=2 Tax=Nannospalax galili TaxID=1026970 RepID=A0A8C6QYR3_NANGA|nr:immunity-related GTPase family M protein-like isoform X2 [Nannospalax galili]
MTETSVSHYTPLSSSFTSVVSYHTGWKILPEVSKNIERALKEGKLLELVSVIKKTVAALSQTPVSIAVTGDTGNGMSSFINALRVIGHEEAASAPTGVVRTTQTPASYSSSHFPNVVLWDLPGTGATAQSVENYLKEMQFSQYGFFIITASEQFSSNHVKLAKAIQEMGKRFYVVWTKLDRDLSTSVLSEIRLLQNIRENIQENLQKERVQEPPIFLVSNLDPLLHDFPKLRDTLHRDLSNIRCCDPLGTLSSICEKIINDKVASWKETIAKGHLKNTLDIRNEDDLRECLKAFRLLFGVDDESLQQVAQSMGTVVMEYKTNIKSQDLHTIRRGDWRLKLMTCLFMNELLRFLGCLPRLCHCVIHRFRRVRHRRVLELVAQDTKTILRKILEDSITLP